MIYMLKHDACVFSSAGVVTACKKSLNQDRMLGYFSLILNEAINIVSFSTSMIGIKVYNVTTQW